MDRPLAIDGGQPALGDFASRSAAAHPAVRGMLASLAADETASWSNYAGQHGERLVAALAERFEAPYCRLCSSGTIGVELALRGLQIGQGDEVILSGYDFPGNFRAIEAVGAWPVLAEIESRGWRLDAQLLAAAASDRARAILVSHLHGDLADMRAIRSFADKHRLAIVEDACQAQGATIDGRPPGAYADACVVSFGGSKLLTSGRGGAVLTRRDEVRQRIKVFCERGNDAVALSELQAAVLAPQLELLTEFHARRSAAAARICQRLADLTMLVPATVTRPNCSPAYYKIGWNYDISAETSGATRTKEERIERFVAAARAEGIPLGRGFRGFAARSERRCRKPMALTQVKRAAEGTVLLHHSALLESDEMIDRIADAIRRVACHPAL